MDKKKKEKKKQPRETQIKRIKRVRKKHDEMVVFFLTQHLYLPTHLFHR